MNDLTKNIGKRAKITESVIAGVTGKCGKIISVHGDTKRGFRYEIRLDEPLSNNNIDTVYVPYFLTEILENNHSFGV